MALDWIDRDGEHTSSPDGGWWLGIAAAALTIVTGLALTQSHPLVLMVLSIALVTGGIVASVVQLLRYRNRDLAPLSYLGVPSLVLFFGFAAAMLGDPDAAVQSLQRLR